MPYDIRITLYCPPDDWSPSEFEIDGVLHRVESKHSGRMRVSLGRVERLTEPRHGHHGRSYTITRVELSASAIRRIERIMYVCTAVMAFCQLFSTTRNGAAPAVAEVPRHITDRVARMRSTWLDVGIENSLMMRQVTAAGIEKFTVQRELHEILGDDIMHWPVRPGARVVPELRDNITPQIVSRLEADPSLLASILALRNFPFDNCLINQIREIAPSILARRAAATILKEL